MQAAAAALNGLSPTELQDYLARNGEDVNFLVDNINHDGGFGYAETSTALGDLLEKAASIQALLGKLGELASSLDAEANANPPSIEAQERARLLGSLIGTVEGGFQFAVDELEQKNQAIEGFTDFLFKAGELIPDLPFPGGGLLKDVALDQLEEWVTDSLTEEAEEPDEALPFHAAFAQGIDNPLLRTAYDAARADVFQNVVKELIN